MPVRSPFLPARAKVHGGYLRNQHSLAAGPLQRMQHVGVLGVPSLHAGVAGDPRRLVPELEETDRGIAAVVEVPDPGADWPVAGAMVKVVFCIGVRVRQVAMPIGQ